MTKEEKKDEMKNKISMALKDPILQQGFELICKENAELKDYRLSTLKNHQTGIQKYALNLEHKLSWYDDQLTKAKEIIKKIEKSFYSGENAIKRLSEISDILAEAEQFLKKIK